MKFINFQWEEKIIKNNYQTQISRLRFKIYSKKEWAFTHKKIIKWGKEFQNLVYWLAQTHKNI